MSALSKAWRWCKRHKKWGIAAIFAAITACQVLHVQLPDWLYTILAAFGFVAVDKGLRGKMPINGRVQP